MDVSSDVEPGSEHIDQIRNIILGPHRREFEGRLGALESALVLFKGDITQQIDELKRAASEEIASGVRLLSERLESLRTAHDEDRISAQERLKDVEAAWTGKMEGMTGQLQKSSAGLVEKVSEARASLRDEHTAGQDRLRREFEERLQAFGTVHVPRVAMADLLIELGMKVRGANGASHAAPAIPAPVPGEAPAPPAETEAGEPGVSAPLPAPGTDLEVMQATAHAASEIAPVDEPEAAAVVQERLPLADEQTPAAEIDAGTIATEVLAAPPSAALDPLTAPVEQVEANAS